MRRGPVQASAWTIFSAAKWPAFGLALEIPGAFLEFDLIANCLVSLSDYVGVAFGLRKKASASYELVIEIVRNRGFR